MYFTTIIVAILASIHAASARPPTYPIPEQHNCTDDSIPLHHNISNPHTHSNNSNPMRYNMTWPTRNITHPIYNLPVHHLANCTCPHCTASSNANFTAQMSYGRTDPPHPVSVDLLVAIGIVVALCVLLILGTCGVVWVKRRWCRRVKGGGVRG
jgi:hypothetical protein